SSTRSPEGGCSPRQVGNYLNAGVGNYLNAMGVQLGNYLNADTTTDRALIAAGTHVQRATIQTDFCRECSLLELAPPGHGL
ncbi:MAG: hypothetical protein ACYCST_19560, partial [Acidimicrobiales bacterium]